MTEEKKNTLILKLVKEFDMASTQKQDYTRSLENVKAHLASEELILEALKKYGESIDPAYTLAYSKVSKRIEEDRRCIKSYQKHIEDAEDIMGIALSAADEFCETNAKKFAQELEKFRTGKPAGRCGDCTTGR